MALPKKARVYWLAPPRTLQRFQDLLKPLFETTMGLAWSHGLQLTIEDNNQCYAVATNLVFGSRPEPCALTKNQAKARAAALLSALASHQKLNALLGSAAIRQLIPSAVDRSIATLIPGADNGPPEHWLVKFTVVFSMLEDGTYRAPIMGAIVDVRVCGAGTVFALNLRVPVLGARSSIYETLLLTPKEQRKAGVKLVYALDDGPQAALMPLYVAVSDDDLELFPATKLSLQAWIIPVRISDHQARLSPSVLGGSGSYSFRWQFWNLSAASENRLVVTCEQTDVDLESGHYHVFLRVTDSKGYTAETGQIVIVPCKREAPASAKKALA